MAGGRKLSHTAAAYRLRWKRRRLLWRSLRSRHRLEPLAVRTNRIGSAQILCLATIRNEAVRLPYFLSHYRRIGVDHFLIVDNDSNDGSADVLCDQPDVSVWRTGASYRAARFGLDWLTWLQMRYGHGRWTLVADADEYLIYAHHETRNLRDLAGWLERQDLSAFGALMLDLYPQGPLGTQIYAPGDNPVSAMPWFDAGPYRSTRQEPLGNLWVQGGVRERMFFADRPDRSPTLNKIPFVKWNRRFAYVNSCHSALPRRLNFAYDGPGGRAPSGVLLHAKFLPQVIARSVEEKSRAQHFRNPDDFAGYYDRICAAPDLWTGQSTRFTGWRQLEELNLMSSGGW